MMDGKIEQQMNEMREQIASLTKRVGMLEGAQKAIDQINNAMVGKVEKLSKTIEEYKANMLDEVADVIRENQ